MLLPSFWLEKEFRDGHSGARLTKRTKLREIGDPEGRGLGGTAQRSLTDSDEPPQVAAYSMTVSLKRDAL